MLIKIERFLIKGGVSYLFSSQLDIVSLSQVLEAVGTEVSNLGEGVLLLGSGLGAHNPGVGGHEQLGGLGVSGQGARSLQEVVRRRTLQAVRLQILLLVDAASSVHLLSLKPFSIQRVVCSVVLE